ncbi:Transport ATP-binding protein CydC [Rhodovastum atsumiense]|uniref:Thiol reductant ABC exporter subunit CydC n=1 Tax=Rhodovastum atsumiense TaxID=504468 RepID=A0A5M6IN62_9PROT|nr:thiol reductant ABC exporter subunit CydC [Rhodovastum atsumiense]KAA5608988.1 thiol reductant ABC exporter subunit CydC [Rhodovastum atsumiense]CAH2599098.1 Transport ATP-binding protein CydC [Rhodovastum atsumiense]
MTPLTPPLLRVLSLWRGRALWLFAGILVTLGALATGMALMGVSGGMVAGLVTGAVVTAPVLLRGLGPVRVVLRYLERLIAHDATFRALADLRVWFFRGLAGSAVGGLGFRRAGDVLARLVNDVEALDGLYIRILLPLSCALILVIGLPLLLAELDPVLAVAVGVLFAVSAFLLPLLAARVSAGAGERMTGAAAALRVAALDAISGLREVRAFGAEGRMLAQVQAREAALLSAQRELAGRGARATAASFLCGQFAILVMLAAAAAHWIADAPAAIAGAFLVVAGFEAVAGLTLAGSLAGHASAAARRVLEAAEGAPPVPDPAVPAVAPKGSALRFEGVHFRWLPDRPPVFEGLTLDIPEGSRIAVLGPSGAGKSTLAALALKVAAPQAGRVLLGGVDIATLPGETVRARIAWLSQASHLFDDTIRNNLLLARPGADEATLWTALEAAHVAAVVRDLPHGIDSFVGEGGRKFSGGQGRRLALARVLLSEAPILILDEPCAGLDAETERDFMATLNDVAQGRTLVLIAHRLTGVERLDRIWRISGGVAVAAAG